jgi:DNA-binding NarL/FixJ family response regulator
MNAVEKHDSGTKKTRIMVVDDHPIVRQGLRLLIDHEPSMVVCAEAESAREALGEIERQQIDMVIVDISIIGSDGVSLTEEIKKKHPRIPVLILTMHDELLYAKRAFRAGAQGYVEKREAAETIVTAIQTVRSGHKYISRKMAEKISRSLG